MDNSNNNGLEYDDNSDMSDKKPHRKGFRNGFGVGIATGIVTTIVLGLIVLFAYTMITGRSVHTVAKSADVLDDKTVQKIDELANYIDEYYYEDYDKDDLENGLLHGVMEGLNDPYSVYYTADEYKELQISTTGTYYGIGAALKQDPNTKQVTVSKVYSGTPSEEAGLKKDDEIVSVDGIEATSEDLTKLVAKIRGKGDALDQILAPVTEVDLHGTGAGVDGVLHHLLDHRCGTVDDLARSNLVGDDFG